MRRRNLPSLTSLNCFEAAARHLSFTRAADELSLTQSAVSKQVSQLEVTLQHPLFRRVRKRLHLTPEGAVYLGEARKILAQVEMSTRYMQSYGVEADVLNIVTLPTFGARWLIPRLNGFRFKYPNINLNIANRTEPFDMQKERIEAAFFFGHGVWPRAECIKLLDEEVVPVCAPTAMEQTAVRDPLDLTDMVLLQVSTRPEGWHDWFEAQDLYTEHSYHGPRFDTFYMALRAARAGCGVALVPKFLAQEELDEGKLVIPWQFSLKSQDAYYMAYPEHMVDVYKLRVFIEWIRARLD
ncbi:MULTISPECIES: LysR substrate-binding domain-containing protein [Halomonadaceae]|jgi:DNA-binding transcriptional LysR family regulator|uniref:LysR family transcriptional regulator n=1 Tax=Vreelandella aquamarina TaxID=77097 RepID=A0A6F8XD13_9GAMM|nr:MULTISPECIES: LysR substrate-binding domain-containing protein [Halomonas]MCC4289503.1 LysR family transcriptional regulator [Halomonas meridiana]MCP1304910.1 LysR substrate-binding domain-containing protein [Halomonas sp. R1t8]MCP1329552.1 LysR substrate-binding domain-containing protein [Halomonas sp. R1t4]TKJ09852.1 LysR family transcriptional regulator [Halomonas sp. 15WGF]BCB71779.1 LysR family transcriptional regulator [Halomonas meridiana]|tara:strand:- start:593 stop:1480 length:888 start_codon:yes stop_codon:yes gene_type:complete